MRQFKNDDIKRSLHRDGIEGGKFKEDGDFWMASECPNKIARVKLERRKQYNQYNLMVSVNKREK